jgi:2-phosphosulfolactate phosphatase
MIVDAIVHPSELSKLAHRGLGEAVCVVFDVLRATSSMVTALANGVKEVIPAATIEEALAIQKRFPQALLGGERHGDKIEGFDLGNSPLEYLNLTGAQIVSTTTNGTIAIQACAAASVVFVGAILNLDAVVEAVRALAPARLIAVCSGTGEDIALEDAWAVGALVDAFQHEECSDAALLSLSLNKAYPKPSEVLRASKNGRALIAKGKLADIEWCETRGKFKTVGLMQNGVIRAWEGIV